MAVLKHKNSYVQEPPYMAFSIFCSLNYILPYFMWGTQTAAFYDPAFTLRIGASCMCFLMIIGPHYFNKEAAKIILPKYWLITLTYSLPYISTYSLFAGNLDTSWIVNSALSIFILALVSNWFSFIVMMTIGSLCGYLTYSAILTNEVFFYHDNILLAIYVHFFSLMIGAFFLYQKEIMLWTIISMHTKLARVNTELEDLVQKRTRYLKHALNAKTEFLNNISHEVRTPLQGIMGISSALVAQWQHLKDHEKLRYTNIIADSGHRLITLVSNLLDLSKFDSGKMLFDMELNNLKDIIDEIVDEMMPVSISKHLPITVHYTNSLINTYCSCDKLRITQLLRNLLGNAFKYTDHGKITITITELHNFTVTAKVKTRAIQVTIQDTGIGIPPNELNSIFLPFSQSSHTKTKAGGTGLGLAIAAEIITAHRGKIWADNNINGGASFSFILPDLSTELDLLQPYPQKVVNYSNFSGCKILFIDDEAACLASGKLILQSAEFEVVTAASAKEAISALSEHKFTAIMLDIMMPDMYGLDLLELIKSNQDWQNIPVIMQSGASDLSELNRAIALGAVSYVIKPYSREQVIKVLYDILLATGKQYSKP